MGSGCNVTMDNFSIAWHVMGSIGVENAEAKEDPHSDEINVNFKEENLPMLQAQILKSAYVLMYQKKFNKFLYWCLQNSFKKNAQST